MSSNPNFIDLTLDDDEVVAPTVPTVATPTGPSVPTGSTGSNRPRPLQRGGPAPLQRRRGGSARARVHTVVMPQSILARHNVMFAEMAFLNAVLALHDNVNNGGMGVLGQLEQVLNASVHEAHMNRSGRNAVPHKSVMQKSEVYSEYAKRQQNKRNSSGETKEIATSCPICMIDYNESDESKSTKIIPLGCCNNIFCEECVKNQCSSGDARCPLCRTNIRIV